MVMRIGDGGTAGGVPSDVLTSATVIPRAGVDPGVQDGRSDSDPNQVTRTLQLYPWWLYKPVDGVDIVLDDQFTFAGAGTHTFTDLTFQLPVNSIGVVRGIDLYINSMLTTTDVVWTLAVNGAPVAGYGTMTMFPRVATSVSRSFDTLIFIPQGAIITLSVQDIDGGAYQVGASYQGWHVNANVPGRNGINPVG